MKQKITTTVFALLSLTLSYAVTPHVSAQGRRPSGNEAGRGLSPGGGAKTPVLEFDKNYFEKSLVSALSANSMGYSVVLIKDGQYVTDVTGNRAKSIKDGDVKMTADTPSNIGSTVKFVTGVALLHHFEQAASKGGPTVDQRLEEPIFNYLPLA